MPLGRRPRRLREAWSGRDQPLYFVTACTHHRKRLLACDPAATGTRPVQTDRAGNQMRAPNRSAVVTTVLDRDGASPLGWRTFWVPRVHVTVGSRQN